MQLAIIVSVLGVIAVICTLMTIATTSFIPVLLLVIVAAGWFYPLWKGALSSRELEGKPQRYVKKQFLFEKAQSDRKSVV